MDSCFGAKGTSTPSHLYLVIAARPRITRRLGDLLGLGKAAKRSYPGQHGQARRKRSEYAIRLEEKQKLRFNYGVSSVSSCAT